LPRKVGGSRRQSGGCREDKQGWDKQHFHGFGTFPEWS
jgi:hypothetical protein